MNVATAASPNVVGHFKTSFVKLLLIIFTIALFLTACNQESKTANQSIKTTTTDTATLKSKFQQPTRYSFSNIQEIVADSTFSTWVDKKDSSYSLALHFQEKDTVAFSYSPECWLVFPYKFDKNQLTVYWDDNIDTKYEFDIVKAAKNIDKNYIGKPFMTLELLNDTILKATYLLKKTRTTINSSNKQRTFFPEQFRLVQEGEMYD
jgi:hypothetical protein